MDNNITQGNTRNETVALTYCARRFTGNASNAAIFYGGYSGIPENVIVNIVIWLIILFIFIILRRLTIYKEYRVVGGVMYTVLSSNFGWIISTFQLNDDDIAHKAGRHAMLYLIFQRYLLSISTGITAISMLVLLPLNFQGTLAVGFGRTTIVNLDGKSPFLWVHSVAACLYLVLTIFFMHKFATKYAIIWIRDYQASDTIMITGVSPTEMTKQEIYEYFSNSYEGVHVESVCFAYDVGNLIPVDKQRMQYHAHREYAEKIKEDTGVAVQVYPYPFACCCECCGHRCKKLDGVTYYQAREKRWQELQERETDYSLQHILNIAFVRFYTPEMAARVYGSGNLCNVHFTANLPCNLPCIPKAEYRLNHISKDWRIYYAPPREDINWEHLSTSRLVWWVRAILLNTALFIILFLFTTPAMLVNLLEEWRYRQALEAIQSPYLLSVCPILLLGLLSALLPWLIVFVEGLTGHWQKSKEQKVIMIKSFIFLLLMLLVLPSFGLTSAKALLIWIADGSTNEKFKFRWQCVFLPDNGAFFVNYVITSALIGTGLQLLRLPSYLFLLLKLLFAKSSAERHAIKNVEAPSFPLGMQYAWVCCIQAIFICYSVICPVISVFGTLYLVMKHFVDRHNLYYVFSKPQTSPGIHQRAVSFIISGAFLLQLWVIGFFMIRSGEVVGNILFTVVVMVLATAFLIGDGIITFFWRKMLRTRNEQMNAAIRQSSSYRYQDVYVPEAMLKNTGVHSVVSRWTQPPPHAI